MLNPEESPSARDVMRFERAKPRNRERGVDEPLEVTTREVLVASGASVICRKRLGFSGSPR
jgi:hypothetical protein